MTALKRTAGAVAFLCLWLPKLALSDQSLIEGGYLLIPRIDIEGFGPSAIIFRIDYVNNYQFTLIGFGAAEPGANESGSFNFETMVLNLHDVILDTGERYSAQLRLLSQVNGDVFELEDATPRGSSELVVEDDCLDCLPTESDPDPVIDPPADLDGDPVVEQELDEEIDPEVTQEVDTEVAEENEPEAAVEVEPEAVSVIEPEAAEENEPEVVLEIEPEVVVEVEPEVVEVIEPEVVVEVEPEVVVEIEPEVIVEIEPELVVEPELEPEVVVVVEPEVIPEPEPVVVSGQCPFGEELTVYDFDPSNLSFGLRGIEAYDSESVTVVDDPLSENGSVIRFHIRSGEIVQNGNRAEMKISEYFPEDYTFHYTFQFMLPADYVSDGRWQSLAQWHDQPDTSIGQTWATYPAHSPPVALLFEDDSVFMYQSPVPRTMNYSNRIAIERDSWNQVEFVINWSLGDNGSVSASINGTSLVDEESGSSQFTGPNLYNRAGNYFKFGIYRGRDAVAENNLYFSDVTIVARCNQ